MLSSVFGKFLFLDVVAKLTSLYHRRACSYLKIYYSTASSAAVILFVKLSVVLMVQWSRSTDNDFNSKSEKRKCGDWAVWRSSLSVP